MKQERIILIGASVRSLAESALAEGLVPFCVDMFGDRDLRACVVEEECRTIAGFSQAAEVVRHLPAEVPAIVVGGGESHEELLQRLQQQRRVAGSASTIRRSPDRLFAMLQQAGCAVPRWSLTPEDRDPVVAKWLHKQMDSSGGLGVTRWSEDSTPAAGSLVASFLQEQLSGPVFSCTWYSAPQTRQPLLVGMALQLSGVASLNATGFDFCGNVGVVNPSPVLQTALEPAATALHTNENLLGFWGMDCVLHDGVPHVVEANLRITASHETQVCDSGPGVVRRQLAAFAGAPTEPVRFQSRPIVRLVVYSPRSLVISKALSDRLFACRYSHSHPARFWLADIPNPGACVPPHTPLCSVYLSDIDDVSAGDLQALADLLPPGCWQITAKWLRKYQGQIDRLQRL
ncbi:MAG: ATP-grasp domain-containing protein [Planctomycetaceae bacterium]|nr:ATP-grasp domain-containing protein [Planctomycetaceae bacterium]